MRRAPVLRALGACFALWFGLATGEYGLANACWAASPAAQPAPAAHHQHHGSSGDSTGTPDQDAAQHANCLTHCSAVVGTTLAFAPVPSLRVAEQFTAPAQPASSVLPGTPSADHPFANGPPPSAV